MSIPNLPSCLIQPQSIVLNPGTSGMPIAGVVNRTSSHVDQIGDIKTGLIIEGLPMVGVSNIPVQAHIPGRTVQQNVNATDKISQILTRSRLNDMVKDIDPTLVLEDDVEEALLMYTDDFITHTIDAAAKIAKHRHVNTIEVKDVQLFLTRSCGIWAPGFGTDEMRPYKRNATSESHKQRLALIRKALKKY
ncbi:hypothetical protein FQA39_LY15015 [Lamprigera yunnana]|nr:hypothetical protein FQA39_LY15015 [Lamprigera yunnana]